MNNIYYLGPSGSFSHIMTKKAGGDYNSISCRNFTEIVSSTLTGKNSIGVLPIENSITSNVHENMDYLFKENLTVIAETYLKIHLNLLGTKNSILNDINKVYSHPQAIAQCAEYISKKNLAIFTTESTASAKDIILKINDSSASVIGGKELADDGQLIILDKDIGDKKLNITRFLFITAKSKEDNTSSDKQRLLEGDRNSKDSSGVAGCLPAEFSKNKASIMFRAHHKPGSLAKILTELAKANFNLTKIESRPIPSTAWEYQFWIDVENESDKEINNTNLNLILKKYTKNYKIIGIYPSGKIYD